MEDLEQNKQTATIHHQYNQMTTTRQTNDGWLPEWEVRAGYMGQEQINPADVAIITGGGWNYFCKLRGFQATIFAVAGLIIFGLIMLNLNARTPALIIPLDIAGTVSLIASTMAIALAPRPAEKLFVRHLENEALKRGNKEINRRISEMRKR